MTYHTLPLSSSLDLDAAGGLESSTVHVNQPFSSFSIHKVKYSYFPTDSSLLTSSERVVHSPNLLPESGRWALSPAPNRAAGRPSRSFEIVFRRSSPHVLAITSSHTSPCRAPTTDCLHLHPSVDHQHTPFCFPVTTCTERAADAPSSTPALTLSQ